MSSRANTPFKTSVCTKVCLWIMSSVRFKCWCTTYVHLYSECTMSFTLYIFLSPGCSCIFFLLSSKLCPAVQQINFISAATVSFVVVLLTPTSNLYTKAETAMTDFSFVPRRVSLSALLLVVHVWFCRIRHYLCMTVNALLIKYNWNKSRRWQAIFRQKTPTAITVIWASNRLDALAVSPHLR